MENTTDIDLFIVNKESDPTFTKTFHAFLQRIPPKVLSANSKLLYSVMHPLYLYYVSINKTGDAVIKEVAPLLAQRAGLTRREFDTAIAQLINVGLVEDITPGLRNKPHCYIVNDWQKYPHLLTMKSVSEIRNEMQQTGQSLKDIEPALGCFHFTKQPSQITNQPTEITKQPMSKIVIRSNNNKLDFKEETPHKEELKESSKFLSLPSSDNLSPPIVTSSSGGGDDYIYTFSDIPSERRLGFYKWDIQYKNSVIPVSKRIRDYLNQLNKIHTINSVDLQG